MKTKIKLLLWSLLTILFVWLSSTYALELHSARFPSINCLSEKNGKNLIDYGMGSSNYFACLKKTDSDDAVDKYWISIPTNFFETKQYYFLYSEKDYSVFRYKNKIKRQIWTSFSYGLWKDEDWLYVFSVYKKDSKITYRKNKLKIKDETLLRVSSKRWTNLFNKWFVYAWIQLMGKKGDQGIGASIIDNTYVLDWINFYIDWNVVYVLDSYSNKMYQYDRFIYKQLQEFPRYMFYLLYNSIPDKIYDVNWNVGTDWTFYDWIKELNYDLSNERSWTEEFLKKIQQDLKNSLQILNKEDIEFYLWMKPEELGLGDNNIPSQNNPQSKEQSYEENLKEYNSCTSYWNNIKTYTTYDKECYRSLLDSAPLTWAVNHKKILAPRNAVVNWNGEWELDIDTEDRICLQFKDRKAVYKQKRSKQWDEFLAISKENWLSPSGINVAEKCGQRPERSLLGKIQDFFLGKKEEKKEEQSDYKLLNDYTSLKVACTSLWKGIGYGMNFLGFDLDLRKCENYWNLSFEEYKQKIKTWEWSWNNLNSDSSLYISWWWKILDPFYSWYNSVNFVSANCWGSKYSEFDIFAYLVFFTIVLYFMRYI